MILSLNHPAVEVIRFPDGQPHVRVREDQIPGEVDIEQRIRNAEELHLLCCLVDALRGRFVTIENLTIPYLMSARSDRRMVPGDAHGLQVVARAINALQIPQVGIVDPHSSVALSLIENSFAIEPSLLLAGLRADVLVVPDSGAMVHAKRRAERLGASEIVSCVKTRDPESGDLRLKVVDPGLCTGKDCIIVDDLCDGGATFTAIAQQLFGVRYLTLAVTHGVFSKGFDALAPAFHRIICSNTYASSYPNQPANLTIRRICQ